MVYLCRTRADWYALNEMFLTALKHVSLKC